MKKLEKRAILCLALAAVMLAGIALFVTRLVENGSAWVSFPANQHLYNNGYISKGIIYDKNGKLLVKNNSKGKKKFNSSSAIRRATVHVVGDKVGNVATGADVVFADKLVGYNLIDGTYTTNNEDRKLYLTVNADICRTANEALDGRNGTVGVYNYKTGEIICMVSSPNYDPTSPPKVSKNDDSGIYINKFISNRIVPGSTFKLVTAMAAMETMKKYKNFSYYCKGYEQYGKAQVDRVKCQYPHGQVDIRKALEVSCNCAFGKLATKVGKDKMQEYSTKAGLLSKYSINGIKTLPSSLEFTDGTVSLAWAGIGQYHDLVNPCSMMIYMGAIANQGKTALPTLLSKLKLPSGLPGNIEKSEMSEELISPETAKTLSKYMRNDVISNYGQGNFPNLKIYAKSGTAELGNGKEPHSWFVGFIKNNHYPYAFVTLVENGGYGSEVAGSVTNTVMQKVISTKSARSR